MWQWILIRALLRSCTIELASGSTCSKFVKAVPLLRWLYRDDQCCYVLWRGRVDVAVEEFHWSSCARGERAEWRGGPAPCTYALVYLLYSDSCFKTMTILIRLTVLISYRHGLWFEHFRVSMIWTLGHLDIFILHHFGCFFPILVPSSLGFLGLVACMSCLSSFLPPHLVSLGDFHVGLHSFSFHLDLPFWLFIH